MNTRTRNRRSKPPFGLRPGYIVIDVSTARGGVTYRRTPIGEWAVNQGNGLQAEHKTQKTVDHCEAVAAIDAIVKRADYILKRNCAHTTFGWFCDEVTLQKVREEIRELQAEAAELNESARRAGSTRQATIGIVPAKIEIGEDAVREVARTIREVLTEIRNALREGSIGVSANAEHKAENKLHAPLHRALNLDRLAVGIAGDAVRHALNRIPVAKREIRDRIRHGDSPEMAGAAVDLGAIETAIAWFEEGGIDGMMGGLEKSDPVQRALVEDFD